MVHLLTLIAPYSRQIRSFVISSRPLRKIISALQTIQPLTRLARFQLLFSSDELLDSPDDALSFRPGSSALDLSTEINCREVYMGTYALMGGVILPTNSISTLGIYFDRTSVPDWRRIATLFEAQRYLLRNEWEPRNVWITRYSLTPDVSAIVSLRFTSSSRWGSRSQPIFAVSAD